MLNRRKQPQNIDGHASDERRALLLGEQQDATLAGRSQSSGPSNATHEQRRVSTLIRNVAGPRRARDGSSEETLRNVNANLNASCWPISHRSSSNSTNHSYGRSFHQSQNQYFNQYQGDSYELTSVDRTGAKAVITIQSTREPPFHNNNHQYHQKHSDHIVYTIQPGDTLHNLSVKYSCPVASIKRLNHLWSDQEFHGLRKIKLPVGKLRLIADVISEQGSPSNGIAGGPQPLSKSYERELIETLGSTIANHSIGNSTNYDPPVAFKQVESVAQLLDDDTTGTLLKTDSVFKNLDQNIEKAREAARSYDDNANALMQTLVEGGNLVANEDDEIGELRREAQRQAGILLNDLSDFGLSYNFLILFIFIVCLAGPLAYVIYLEETHRDPQHHQQHNPT